MKRLHSSMAVMGWWFLVTLFLCRQATTLTAQGHSAECTPDLLWDADTPRLPKENPFDLEGKTRSVRIQGIDAPERCDRCPKGRSSADCPNEACSCRSATLALQRILREAGSAGGVIAFDLTGYLDKFGRSVGRMLCRLPDGTVVDPALRLLRDGDAILYFADERFLEDHPDYVEVARIAFEEGRISERTWAQLRWPVGVTTERRMKWYEKKLEKVNR